MCAWYAVGGAAQPGRSTQIIAWHISIVQYDECLDDLGAGRVCDTHDSGLALLQDGVPALVLEEERFSRQKHTLKFPLLSLEAAFAELKLDIGDIDVMTTPWDTRQLRRTFGLAVTRREKRGAAYLRKRDGTFPTNSRSGWM